MRQQVNLLAPMYRKQRALFSARVSIGICLLVGVALFVLRAKEPAAPRPFRVPGYPVVPALFILMCGYLLYSSLAYHGKHALVGLAVLGVGAVVILVSRGRTSG